MNRTRTDPHGRRRWAALVVVMLALGGFVATSPAWADTPGETTEAYLLVQQALGHLAHDTSADGIMLATEKVDDALAVKEQAGVNVAEVRQAKDALAAGQVDQARALLQDSITEALSQLKPATGDETGTKVVLSELPGRSGLTAGDVAVLVLMVALVLVGAGLAWRFRPPENLRELRRLVTSSPPAQPSVSSPTASKERS